MSGVSRKAKNVDGTARSIQHDRARSERRRCSPPGSGKEAAMTKYSSDFGAGFWAQSLGEVDREIARLATICNVRLLEPGIVERVLANDASVCGTANAMAFDKLRNVLMMHYAVRNRAADAIGSSQASALVDHIVDDLRKKFGDRLGGPPAAG
jgi:hypothetical protein